MKLRLVLLLAAAWLAGGSAWAQLALGGSAVVTTEQVRAELVAHAPQGVVAGKPVWLGLVIEHKPHWHTYWKNPGDSGLPTNLSWQLPAGFVAGEIDWPTPKRLPVGPLVNYGFEGTLLLPVRVEVPPAFEAAALEVKLHADWLVCKDVCIPESGEFVLSVPTQAATGLHGSRFEAAWAARPQTAAGANVSAQLEGSALAVSAKALPASLRGQTMNFFPETPGVIDNAARPTQRWEGDQWQLRVPLSAQRSESPTQMHAVLAPAGGGAGVRVGFDISGTWPAAGAVASSDAEAPGGTLGAGPIAADSAPAAAPPSLWFALLLALAGGALLNLMPCVFPVLSLKVLGFAAHAHERRTLLAGGLAYTAGVVLSFLALAALMLVLRAGGEQLGWGFQLQAPGFVAALAVLFTLIGLNLMGLFEMRSLLPSSVATLRARHPLADSALTGALAVAVASPCTAPFMGASLGAAASLPATQSLLLFAVLGLGMALPYLLASAWPALARALPRPGAWMVRFKTLMAFPMFATVVWLLWVLGQQTGIDGATALLALLLALTFVIWALATPGLGRKARAGFGLLSLLAFGATLAWALPALHEAPPPANAQAGEGRWQPWSTARVAELKAQGRPVFVDFTAAWCVTCQVNKRTTLNDATVIADFELRNVALLRADWTRRDAAITAELARLGRNGVPVYALYSPGQARPQLLGELLSVKQVRDALSNLQGSH